MIGSLNEAQRLAGRLGGQRKQAAEAGRLDSPDFSPGDVRLVVRCMDGLSRSVHLPIGVSLVPRPPLFECGTEKQHQPALVSEAHAISL